MLLLFLKGVEETLSSPALQKNSIFASCSSTQPIPILLSFGNAHLSSSSTLKIRGLSFARDSNWKLLICYLISSVSVRNSVSLPRFPFLFCTSLPKDFSRCYCQFCDFYLIFGTKRSLLVHYIVFSSPLVLIITTVIIYNLVTITTIIITFSLVVLIIITIIINIIFTINTIIVTHHCRLGFLVPSTISSKSINSASLLSSFLSFTSHEATQG